MSIVGHGIGRGDQGVIVVFGYGRGGGLAAILSRAMVFVQVLFNQAIRIKVER